MFKICCSALLFIQIVSTASAASLVPFSSQSDFEAALPESFTLIDLRDLGSTLTIDVGDQRLLDRGLDVVSVDPRGMAGTTRFGNFAGTQTNIYPANTTASGRFIRILFNGSRTMDRADDLTLNFLGGANGFGYAPNRVDRGIIEFFSGPNLTGRFLGSVENNGSGSFVGGVSEQRFRSARVTCDFDGDYTCGVTDLQFGTSVAAVPVPTSSLLFVSVLGMASLVARRRAVRG